MRRLKSSLIEHEKRSKWERDVLHTAEVLRGDAWGLTVTSRGVLTGKTETDEPRKAENEAKLAADLKELTTEAAKKLQRLHKLAREDGDGASAFRWWGAPYEQLDRMQAAAERRFQMAVDQLDIHKQGRGLRLRKVSDEIVDAEFEPISVEPVKPDTYGGSDPDRFVSSARPDRNRGCTD
jgi:hypothetical protein